MSWRRFEERSRGVGEQDTDPMLQLLQLRQKTLADQPEPTCAAIAAGAAVPRPFAAHKSGPLLTAAETIEACRFAGCHITVHADDSITAEGATGSLAEAVDFHAVEVAIRLRDPDRGPYAPGPCALAAGADADGFGWSLPDGLIALTTDAGRFIGWMLDPNQSPQPPGQQVPAGSGERGAVEPAPIQPTTTIEATWRSVGDGWWEDPATGQLCWRPLDAPAGGQSIAWGSTRGDGKS